MDFNHVHLLIFLKETKLYTKLCQCYDTQNNLLSVHFGEIPRTLITKLRGFTQDFTSKLLKILILI